MSGRPAIPPGAITALPLRGRFPRISITSAPTAPWTDAYERAWQRSCDANPRLHDGPIWSVAGASETELTVHIDSYKRLAIQADPGVGDLGVRHVGVKGLTTATDAGGVERILLARRGTHTRAYPNLWEIAPAGGVEAHAPLSPDSIIATLVQEAREELGVDAAPSAATARPFLMVRDEIARSLVFMIHLRWPGPLDHAWKLPATWEYSESRWLTRDEAARWLQASPHDITPPAAAALSAFLNGC